MLRIAGSGSGRVLDESRGTAGLKSRTGGQISRVKKGDALIKKPTGKSSLASRNRMRVHQGKFAYELKLVRDRKTQIATGWEFRIFEAKPREQEKLLFIGKTRPTRELAEHEAEQVIELLAYNKMAYNKVA